MRKFVYLALAASVFAAPAVAQNINATQKSQESRIAHGEASGQLAPGEAHRMQANEAGIAREEAIFRAKHHGRLTAYDRKRLAARQVRASHRIYKYKHDHRVG